MPNFAKPTLAESHDMGKAREGDIYIKGVTVRFGFDVLELRNFLNSLSKTKQRGRPVRCIYVAT